MLVRIEISKNSNLKYEYSEKDNTLYLDRVLPSSNFFPYNYGYIPETLAPDNDAVDIILISSHQLQQGCMVNVNVVGGIETTDENGKDDKILCVLNDKVDKENTHINDISDIPETKLTQIKYFLQHYKDNDGKKFIKIGEIYNKESALQFIDSCRISSK